MQAQRGADRPGDAEDEACTKIGIRLRPLGDYTNGLELFASGRIDLCELGGIDATKRSKIPIGYSG
jgi:hypothetical protein